MLLDEGTQTSANLHQPHRIVQEGIALWNTQKEALRLKKIQEQREMREMLEKYYPWGTEIIKPRGLRNLRLEGLFPNKDFLKAKRAVSPLELGRPGGGAPMITHSGKKIVHTIEDPVLRFQWNKDLRKAVDNTLRYKIDQHERAFYKKQLDEQVAERKLRERKEKRDNVTFHQRSFLKSPPWGKPGPGGTIWRPPGNIGINFLKSLGWSTENTLKALDRERRHFKNKETFLNVPPKVQEYPRKESDDANQENFYTTKNVKLSPLNKPHINGEELVPLMAEQRAVPIKIPLATTDVTRGNSEIKRQMTPTYLRELKHQMEYKKQLIKKMKIADIDTVCRHFSTLDGFWGRPGHGAPRSTIKKGRLDKLLYDRTILVR